MSELAVPGPRFAPQLSLERPLYSLRLRGRHLNRGALAFLQSFEQTRG
jgi:hypothetical protein